MVQIKTHWIGEFMYCIYWDNFKGIRIHLEQNKEEWKTVFDDAEPHISKFPAPWSEKLSEFQSVLVICCIRPDRAVPALQNFVQSMNNLLSGV